MRTTPRHVLYMLCAAAALEGLFDAREVALGARVSALPLVSMALLSFLCFYWYRLDAEAHGYRRSRWLNTGIVAFGVVAIPYYLARSRPRGRKLRALLRLVGFALLQCVAAFAGAIAGTLMFGMP